MLKIIKHLCLEATISIGGSSGELGSCLLADILAGKEGTGYLALVSEFFPRSFLAFLAVHRLLTQAVL